MNKIKTFLDITFISFVKWLYNHWEWFNRFLKKRARHQGELNEILLDVCLSDRREAVADALVKLSKLNNHDVF